MHSGRTCAIYHHRLHRSLILSSRCFCGYVDASVSVTSIEFRGSLSVRLCMLTHICVLPVVAAVLVAIKRLGPGEPAVTQFALNPEL